MNTPRTRDYELFPSHLLDEIRARFEYVDRCPRGGDRVFLDSASGSLRLREVVGVVGRETAVPDQIDRDSVGSRHVMDTISAGEEDVRVFLGGKSGTVVPELTATHALFRVVREAVAFCPGTNIVTTSLDHPAVFDSMSQAAHRHGKELRVADPCPATGRVLPDSILELVDRDTSVLGFIHGANVTGAYLDAESIIRQARNIRDDLCAVVDGVQYAPYASVDFDGMDADAYVFAPYKSYGMKGLAFALLSERFGRIPHDRIIDKDPASWHLGSEDHAGYAAWSATVDYLCWLGSHFTESTDRRELVVAAMYRAQSHTGALLDRLMSGRDGLPGLTSLDHVEVHALEGGFGHRSCVVPFNIRGIDARSAARAYADGGILLQGRRAATSQRQFRALGVKQGEIVRISAAHYTAPHEIDRFLEMTARLGGT